MVKRYGSVYRGEIIQLAEVKDGDYVKYKDYEELQKKHNFTYSRNIEFQENIFYFLCKNKELREYNKLTETLLKGAEISIHNLEKENEKLKKEIEQFKNTIEDKVPCSNCGEQMIYIDRYICDKCENQMNNITKFTQRNL